jgi:diguanylate cyclase (GGDEF) domain
MDGDLRQPGYQLSAGALDQLMPMFLWLDVGCRIRAAGPTLLKLMGAEAIGQKLEQVFHLRKPRHVDHAGTLVRAQRLQLALRSAPGTAFKGVAVPLMGDGGVLVNLSFGFGVRDAVREHGLSATDFAVTDLAIELLYLVEAKNAVMGELTRMADRLKGAKARAEEQAATDPLTGLGNRRAMEAGLKRLLRAGEGFALLHIDLDYFKQVNDTLGHAAGDHVLAEVAARLRRSVRAGDLVSRVGGDEFVILLSGVGDRQALERVGVAIYDNMRPPIAFDGRPCAVALSVGSVIVPPGSGQGAQSLLALADRALYASKGAGRARMMLWDADMGPVELARAPLAERRLTP